MTPEDLVEHELIKRLKYRYVRALDTKSWEELAACFSPDATASYSGGQLSFEGRDAIIGFLTSVLGSDEVLTSHAVGQAEIQLLEPGRARGTWALQDVVIHAAAAVEIRGASFYEDEYVKGADGWTISHTGYRRVYEQMAPRAPDVKLTARWSTGGKSELMVER